MEQGFDLRRVEHVVVVAGHAFPRYCSMIRTSAMTISLT
jgi:hypothetical protein